MDYLIYRLSALDFTPNLGLLPPAEQAEAARRGNRYAIIRQLLRQELARRTGLSPAEMAFTYSPHGKPEFPPQPFNISHSGDCLCLAFHHRSIGVDVERMRPRRFHQLAGRFMCPEQLEGFLTRGCPELEFYTCWCAAEALVKHAGDTIWNAPRYPFRYNRGHIECLYDLAPCVKTFSPMPGYVGAVAYTI